MPVMRYLAQRSILFWVLTGYLALVALLGGSARADTLSLMLLRPAAVLVGGYALWRLPREAVVRYWPLFVLFGAALALVLLHLLPLPPALWQALPGRGIVVEIDRLTGAGELWRPLSLAPKQTWNAFFALLVPLAALLLAVQLDAEERGALVPVLLVIGLFSVLLGALQLLGPATGPLYFYRITNYGSPVGIFANRNHFAVFAACMLPMLAFWAARARTTEGDRVRLIAAAAAALVVLPILLLAGSRAGVLAGLLCIAAVPLLYRKPQAETRGKAKPARGPRWGRYAAGIAGVAVIALLVAFLADIPAVEGLMAKDVREDARMPAWQAALAMAWHYFPFGSGLGSFVETYKLDEPFALLKPSYFNHAHNDPLELLVTGGLPAVLLAAAAVVLVLLRTWQVWRQPANGRTALARLGSVLLVTLLLASIADYPLRVPSLACIAVLLLVWIEGAVAQKAQDTENVGSGDGYRLSGSHSPL